MLNLFDYYYTHQRVNIRKHTKTEIAQWKKDLKLNSVCEAESYSILRVYAKRILNI